MGRAGCQAYTANTFALLFAKQFGHLKQEQQPWCTQHLTTACASCLQLMFVPEAGERICLAPSLVLCCCWAASEPMQPTPPLLSAEEGVRVSLSASRVRWKCPSACGPARQQVPSANRNREVVEFLAERRDG